MSRIDFTKPTELVTASGDLLTSLRFTAEWQAAAGTSKLFGGLQKKFSKVDLDACGVGLNQAGNPIGACWYNARNAFRGGLVLGADSAGKGGELSQEEINADLTLLPRNVESVALGINTHNGKTFSNVNSAILRVEDTSGATPQLVHEIYVEINSSYNAVVAAILRRDKDNDDKWTIQEVSEFGHANDWQGMGRIAAPLVRAA